MRARETHPPGAGGRRIVPAIVLFWTIAAAIGAQEPAADAPYTLTEVAPRVWAAIANPKVVKGPAGGNAGFIIGDEGIVIVDTFASGEAARTLQSDIRRRTPAPARFVVNTHYHLDHVAGNGVFADAGAVVLAHRRVRDWIRPENLKFFGKDVKPEQKAFIESLAAPTAGYEDGIDLHVGGREVRVRSFPGHTGGDSIVIVPDAKVVFAGDLFWRYTLPNMIDASLNAWIETLDRIATDFAGYTFVPGHGSVATVADVQAFRDYLVTVRTLVADARSKGRSGDPLVEAVLPELTRRYGHWDFFQFLAPLNIRETDAELSGTKRIPRE